MAVQKKMKRLMNDLKLVREERHQYIDVGIKEDNMYEWYFLVRGPKDSHYDGGYFIGKLLVPNDYPMAPPDIILLTPNGRFLTDEKICLSNLSWHPEEWSAMWSINSILSGFLSIMLNDTDHGIGHIRRTAEERYKLAKDSIDYNKRKHKDLLGLFKRFLDENGNPIPVDKIEWGSKKKAKKNSTNTETNIITSTDTNINAVQVSITDTNAVQVSMDKPNMEDTVKPTNEKINEEHLKPLPPNQTATFENVIPEDVWEESPDLDEEIWDEDEIDEEEEEEEIVIKKPVKPRAKRVTKPKVEPVKEEPVTVPTKAKPKPRARKALIKKEIKIETPETKPKPRTRKAPVKKTEPVIPVDTAPVKKRPGRPKKKIDE